MRKAFIFIFILLFIPLSLFATPGSATDAYSPLYLRNLSMGGTSVASSRYEEVLFSNPALVGSDNEYFALPSLSMTLYNINTLVQPGGALDILLTQNNGQDDVDRAFNQLINSIGPGRGDVVSAQASVGFISGIVGLGLDMGVDVHSNGQGGEASTLVLEGNFALSVALSLPLTLAGDHTFSFGIGAHLVFRGYTTQTLYTIAPGGFTAGSLIDIYSDEDSMAAILNSVPVAFGFAVPVDLGFTYDWRDIFTFGLVLKNLNGDYHMQSYSAVNQLYYMLTGGYIGSSVPGNPETGASGLFSTPFTLDAGICVSTPDQGFFTWLDFTFALDLVDIVPLFTSGLDAEAWISRLRAGLELSLMRTFDFRVGLNAGYLSFGFTFDFQIFTLDLVYATLEYGDRLGDKGMDLFSVAFTLGLES